VAFADAVVETLQRDQGERVARGRAIADAFDWTRIGTRILDVFRNVAAPPAERISGVRSKVAA
jgi:glycosyltransferase involved in cell wall biosynthesis